ncbi:hypothetical protein C8K18_1278 [Paraburkholderia sp. GV068]|nr:hypothetical protein C8K19_1278 [Paraburkholderia sp. GV072]PUA93872.1 hypothetical protein C8K18_1278 [Paraburkholderia sp. GV068]
MFDAVAPIGRRKRLLRCPCDHALQMKELVFQNVVMHCRTPVGGQPWSIRGVANGLTRRGLLVQLALCDYCKGRAAVAAPAGAGNGGQTNPAADRLVHSQKIFRHSVRCNSSCFSVEACPRDVSTLSLLQHSPLSIWCRQPFAIGEIGASTLVRITNRIIAIMRGDRSVSGGATQSSGLSGALHFGRIRLHFVGLKATSICISNDRAIRRYRCA